MGHLFMFKDIFNIIIFIILATSVQKSRSADPQFGACKPQNCGKGPNISYPFYIPLLQEPYCGHPELEITCKDEGPVLFFSDDDYYLIKDIFYNNHSVLMTNSRALKNDCPVPPHNFTIELTPFEFGSTHLDLLFFYYCTVFDPIAPVGYPVWPVPCASNRSHHSFTMFVPEGEFKHTNYSSVKCKSVVSAPVDMEIGWSSETIEEMGYSGFLKKGFLLEWDAKNCSECEGSDGGCGFYENEFVCFCPDGRFLKSCTDGKSSQTGKVIGIGAGAGALLVLALLFFYCYRRRRSRSRSGHLLALAKSKDISPSSTPFTVTPISNPPLKMDVEKGGSTYFGVPIFSYDELVEATNNFDSNKELGEGGFGTVYHGKLRDGRVVAVKRLYENTFKRVEQFMNEVEILTRLRHQNLVTLYGCTSRHSRELLLVYEYIPNGTVADHLHGDRARTGPLTWPIRMSIAIETASALSYLHATDIIHRDVKSNNILLDNNFRVKVADFGLSRLFPPDVSHVSTAPQGTPGYVDPEYHQCYQLTDKSDVYSFGVVLIELISSKPAVDTSRHRYEINLANMAMNKIQNQTLHELVDPALGFESNYDITRMATQVAELAFRCLQLEREMRPTMDEVLDALRKIENEEYTVEKAEVVVIPSDDVGLLKSCPPPVSPDSVTEKWVSWSSTPPSATVSI